MAFDTNYILEFLPLFPNYIFIYIKEIVLSSDNGLKYNFIDNIRKNMI